MTDLTKLSPELLAALSKDQLLAVIEGLKAQPSRKLSLKVSDKGGIALCGLRRFPVVFYAQEWERILAEADAIRAFAKANSAKLTTK